MGTLHGRDDQPLHTEGVPEEEGISQADVAERLDKDPDEQLNATDPDSDVDLHAPQERVSGTGHDTRDTRDDQDGED